jgi:hypothetical protein
MDRRCHNYRTRLPSWISLNDNLSVKAELSSSSPSKVLSSPQRVSDEDGFFQRNCRTNSSSSSITSSHRSGPIGSITEGNRKSCISPKENLKPLSRIHHLNCDFSSDIVMDSDEENVASFRRGLLRFTRCNSNSAPNRTLDWTMIRQYVLANATPDNVTPRIIIPHQENYSPRCYDTEVYYPTILGYLCKFNMTIGIREEDDIAMIKSDIVDLFRFVIDLCPEQIHIGQYHPGHNTLRDAVCNPTMLSEVIGLLMSHCPEDRKATLATTSDMNGLTPIDHLVQVIQMDDNINDYHNSTSVSTMNTLESLRIIVHHTASLSSHSTASNGIKNGQNIAVHDNIISSRMGYIPSLKVYSSPLIRLLSLGTSFGGSFFSTAPSSPNAGCRHPIPLEQQQNQQLGQEQHYNQQPTRNTIEQPPRKPLDRLGRILQCVQILLQWDPMLLHTNSASSDCTPLHVAIRNYGNYRPLIHALIQHDTIKGKQWMCTNGGVPMNNYLGSCSQLQHRNRFGDLPLHVACSVGVPINVLQLVLQETAAPSLPPTCSGKLDEINNYFVPNSLIWSCNNAGYTPVDLEWIRHIEVGCSFHSHRPFYPLDSRGIQQQQFRLKGNVSRRYDEMYEELLRQAVDQVMEKTQYQRLSQHNKQISSLNRSVIEEVSTPHKQQENKYRRQPSNSRSTFLEDRDEEENEVGLLLARIFRIIRGSFPDFAREANRKQSEQYSYLLVEKNSKNIIDSTNEYILHLACALSSPYNNGPTLPRPLLELILWKYPEQLRHKEMTRGKLPLHIALSTTNGNVPESMGDLQPYSHGMGKAQDEWKAWIQLMIRSYPQACGTIDMDGRLPIHHALDCNAFYSRATYNDTPVEDNATNEIIQTLITEFPSSLESVDPISKLFPFQLAALNQLVSLDTVYTLLRRWPSGVLA